MAEKVRAAFRRHDTRGDGRIDRATLSQVLQASGCFDNCQVEQVFEAFASSKSSPTIAYDAFVDFLFGVSQVEDGRAPDPVDEVFMRSETPGDHCSYRSDELGLLRSESPDAAEAIVQVEVLSMDAECLCKLQVPRGSTVRQLRAEVSIAIGVREVEVDLVLGLSRLQDMGARPLLDVNVMGNIAVLHVVRRIAPDDLDVLYASMGGVWRDREAGDLSLDNGHFSQLPEACRVELLVAVSVDVRVRRLGLTGNGLQDLDVQLLGELLERSVSIAVLDLGENVLGDDAAQCLAQALECNTSLQELRLSNNAIGDAGVLRVAAALEKCASLQRLLLDGNPVGFEGAERLCEAQQLARERGTIVEIVLPKSCDN